MDDDDDEESSEQLSEAALGSKSEPAEATSKTEASPPS
jgi:hypothetical protein